MDEKAFIFFTLLNESYRQDASSKLQWASVIALPHMKKENQSSVLNSLKMQAREPSDLFSNEGSSPEELKRFFGKK